MVKGGLARKLGITAKDVNKNQLKMGIKVEMEHTSDRKKAKQIALDHLAEYPKYYTGLNKMEKRMKPRQRVSGRRIGKGTRRK